LPAGTQADYRNATQNSVDCGLATTTTNVAELSRLFDQRADFRRTGQFPVVARGENRILSLTAAAPRIYGARRAEEI